LVGRHRFEARPAKRPLRARPGHQVDARRAERCGDGERDPTDAEPRHLGCAEGGAAPGSIAAREVRIEGAHRRGRGYATCLGRAAAHVVDDPSIWAVPNVPAPIADTLTEVDVVHIDEETLIQ